MQLVAILLAAGTARRFGGPKLSVSFRGKPLFRHALDTLVQCSRVESVYLVVNPSFARTALPERCFYVDNSAFQNGMSSSLKAGVMAAPESADAYLLALADMPKISLPLLEQLISFFEQSGKDAVIPTYGGRRGHPVLISSCFKKEILCLEGDVGARNLLKDYPQRVGELNTEDPGILFDVDRPADLT